MAGEKVTTATGVTLIGGLSGDALTTGGSNVAVGKSALSAETGGAANVAVGLGTLAAQNVNSTGYNTAVGHEAGNDVTSGVNNTLIGALAGDALTDADNNTAVGFEAMSGNTLGSAVVIGYRSFKTLNYGSATSGLNVGVGNNSGTAATTAQSSTLIGSGAGSAITTGSENTCIGRDAGNHAIQLQTGGSNTLIGAFADTSATGSNSQIVLGRDVTGSGNATFTFGNNTSDSAIANGATSISAPSDIRLKEDIEDETVGLEFINELRPVTFRWKKAKDVPSEMKAHSDSEERVMNGKYNHGFIAQEVKSVIDKYDIKDGFGMWVEDEADGRQRIAEGELMSILVKAVQELSAEVKKLKGE